MDTRIKKLTAVTGAILALYLLITAAAAPPAMAPEAHTAFASGAADPVWHIREEEGRVAVFFGEKPVLLTDTKVSELPKADRSRLSSGIDVYSEKELKKLIEDLCS